MPKAKAKPGPSGLHEVREVWVLRQPSGLLTPPIDEAGNPFLAFGSFDEAVESAIYHRENWDVVCEPELLCRVPSGGGK